MKEIIDFINTSVYDEENSSYGGDCVTAREKLEVILKEAGVTQAEAAREIGQTPQKLNGKIVRNSLKADEFFDIMESIGVDVEFRVRDSGKVINLDINTGYGRRVRCMVDRVSYDTAKSTALANNFYADGVNEYNDGKAFELYMDTEYRYFFAEYSCWEGVKDRITPVTAEDAARFIEKYGTSLHKHKEVK